jgi:pSer/pThr/pTyr-binding forkhead associated (FHA) protein
MTLKRWVLGKTGGRKPAARGDVRSHVTPSFTGELAAGNGVHEPTMGAANRDVLRGGVAHLGPYAPLIGAIRDELERFVIDELRLHLAIAERDRYVLTSIEVDCEGSDEHRELLRKFVGEFKPEQIKQYLAREVIAGLRNASAVDLGQFAGLNASAREHDAKDADDGYAELIAELRSASPQGDAQPYQVTIVGRWSQSDAPGHGDVSHPAAARAAPDVRGTHTPLAGRVFTFDIEDAAGSRSVELESVVPGRRYAVGKGEGSDIVVDGLYSSRRHCEIWYDRGAWWVADTGSTNGIRVESRGAFAQSRTSHPAGNESIELPPGASLVLSASLQGEPRQYPRLTLRAVETGGRTASIAATGAPTPVTPIAPSRRRDRQWLISARMASGPRDVELGAGSLPFSIGRSRNQTLVIDWAHADVSGRHVEIVAFNDDGVSVVVHGDNGVRVDATAYGSGARFRWKPGETLTLGGTTEQIPACTLALARTGADR